MQQGKFEIYSMNYVQQFWNHAWDVLLYTFETDHIF